MDGHPIPQPLTAADTYHYQMHHSGVAIGLSYSVPPPPPPNQEPALLLENNALKSQIESLKNEIKHLKMDKKAAGDALATWYRHAESLRKLVVEFSGGLAGVLDSTGDWKGSGEGGSGHYSPGTPRRWT